jgi:hypothetical protein
MENKPGKLEKVTGLLAGAGLNIRAITIADADDFGVLKLLVDNPAKAAGILKEAGPAAALKEAVAVRVSDEPGGLDRIARMLSEHRININDAYGFVLESGRSAVFVIRVADPRSAEKILTEAGCRLIGEKDLYSL